MDDMAQKFKRLLVKLTLFLFKGFIFVRQILNFFWKIIKNACLLLFKLSAKFGGKEIVLASYKSYFFFKRAVSKIFLPAKNKYLYPFINKEAVHVIIIILALIICAENIKLKLNRTQNIEELIGTKSVLAIFATEELEDTMLIEEKISAEDLRKNKSMSMINHGLKKSDQVNVEEEESDTARMLTQSGGLLKPDIMDTGEEAAAAPERTGVIEYIVRAGDVLGSIAAKFNISVNTIIWTNDLTYNGLIRPGDKLRILPATGVLHIVSSGETLLSIARKYNVNTERIKQYNNLANADKLKKGQELLIPEGIKPATFARPAVIAKNPSANPYSLKQIFAPDKSIYSTNSKFIWPTPRRRITQYYHLGHSAIDIGDKTGTPIYAIEKGQVLLSGWSGGYGNNIVIDHGAGQKSRYGHFSKLYVKKGSFVEKGQQIGAMGSTGNSTGPHLHIEIVINGKKVNPLSYLK